MVQDLRTIYRQRPLRLIFAAMVAAVIVAAVGIIVDSEVSTGIAGFTFTLFALGLIGAAYRLLIAGGAALDNKAGAGWIVFFLAALAGQLALRLAANVASSYYLLYFGVAALAAVTAHVVFRDFSRIKRWWRWLAVLGICAGLALQYGFLIFGIVDFKNLSWQGVTPALWISAAFTALLAAALGCYVLVKLGFARHWFSWLQAGALIIALASVVVLNGQFAAVLKLGLLLLGILVLLAALSLVKREAVGRFDREVVLLMIAPLGFIFEAALLADNLPFGAGFTLAALNGLYSYFLIFLWWLFIVVDWTLAEGKASFINFCRRALYAVPLGFLGYFLLGSGKFDLFTGLMALSMVLFVLTLVYIGLSRQAFRPLRVAREQKNRK